MTFPPFCAAKFIVYSTINLALCFGRNFANTLKQRRYRAMLKPDSWQSTTEYRIALKKKLKKLRKTILHDVKKYRDVISKMENLALDSVGKILEPLYPDSGRPAKNQCQILRSLVLFSLLLGKTSAKLSLTSWVRDELPSSPLFIALIGCGDPSSLPPLGSYYDFMNRCWQGDRQKYSKDYAMPAGKNGKKPKKNIGGDGKLEEEASYKTKPLSDALIAGRRITDNPEAVLQDIFFNVALLPSIRLGLIDTENLTLSGDGTAVPSHNNPFGRRLPSDSGGELRHYNDPDASWGYDSSKKTWYFGFSLYMLCCRNSMLKVELPLSMSFTTARRHDSINFLYSFDHFTSHCRGIVPKNVCLDSAHDNIPTYRLLDHFGINALIDINGRCNKSSIAPDDVTLDKDGKPYCMNGSKMVPWGNDPIKDAHKYRCPYKCGRIDSCPHAQECCKDGKYGRTVYIKNNGDLRFNTRIPRGSEEYKRIYKERTACERVNNRVLNDYCLQSLKIRGIDHFSFWTMLIGICIHLDARCKTAALN